MQAKHRRGSRLLAPPLAGFLITSCISFPPHGFSAEPPQRFIELAEQGCRWEAKWPSTHHSSKWTFGMCMARVGLYRRYTRALAVWSAPPRSDAREDLVYCAEAAREVQKRFDRCAIDSDLIYDSNAYPLPYQRPGADRRDIKEEVQTCARSADLEAFDRFVGRCLYDRGWEVHSVDSRGRTV
jgi:hypothetical protein